MSHYVLLMEQSGHVSLCPTYGTEWTCIIMSYLWNRMDMSYYVLLMEQNGQVSSCPTYGTDWTCLIMSYLWNRMDMSHYDLLMEQNGQTFPAKAACPRLWIEMP